MYNENTNECAHNPRSVAASVLFRYECGENVEGRGASICQVAQEYGLTDFLGSISGFDSGPTIVRNLCLIRAELLGIGRCVQDDTGTCGFADKYTQQNEPGTDGFDCVAFLAKCKPMLDNLARNGIDANPLSPNPRPSAAGSAAGVITAYSEAMQPTTFNPNQYWKWLNDNIRTRFQETNPLDLPDSVQYCLSTLLADTNNLTVKQARAQMIDDMHGQLYSKFYNGSVTPYPYGRNTMYINYPGDPPTSFRYDVAKDDDMLVSFAVRAMPVDDYDQIKAPDNSKEHISEWTRTYAQTHDNSTGLNIYIDGENVSAYKAMVALKEMQQSGVKIDSVQVFISDDRYPMWKYLSMVANFDDFTDRQIKITEKDGTVVCDSPAPALDIVTVERVLTGKSAVDLALAGRMKADHEHLGVNNVMLWSSDCDYMSMLKDLTRQIEYKIPGHSVVIPPANVCVCYERWNERASPMYAEALRTSGIEALQLDGCDASRHDDISYVQAYVLHQCFYQTLSENCKNPKYNGQPDKMLRDTISYACQEAQVTKTKSIEFNLTELARCYLADTLEYDAHYAADNAVTRTNEQQHTVNAQNYTDFDPTSILREDRNGTLPPDKMACVNVIRKLVTEQDQSGFGL